MNAADYDLGGYAELRGTWQVGVEGVPWNLTERVRPTFEVAPAERVTVEATVEASLTQGRVVADEAAGLLFDSELGPLLEMQGCTYTSEPRYDELSDYISVERLHVDVNLPAADLSIGRQAVNWGSALVFHPTDRFNEIVATEPWRERKGVNAVKATVPFGDHEVIGVVAIDDDLSPLFSESDEDEVPVTGAVKATARALGTDWSAVANVGTDGPWFVGGDLRGTLGVGWWVEGGWHGDVPGASGETVSAPEIVAGIDYSLPFLYVFYVAAEYRYDGTGVAPEDYDFTQRGGFGDVPIDCEGFEYATGTRETLGRHYVDAALRVGFTEDFAVQAAAIYNVEDGTGIAVPDVSANIGERVAVHVGAQIPFGEDGEYKPAARDLEIRVNQYDADLSGLLPDVTALAWVRTSF